MHDNDCVLAWECYSTRCTSGSCQAKGVVPALPTPALHGPYGHLGISYIDCKACVPPKSSFVAL
jgi:hypothetical protein